MSDAFRNYDQWKTSPPDYYDEDDVRAGKCDHCRTTLYHGEDVYFDSREGYTFCDKECFKEWLLRHIEEEIDYYIELLEDNKDTYTEVIEADLSEQDYYDGIDREEDL